MKKLVINKEDLKNNIKILTKKLEEESIEKNAQIIGVVKGNGMGLGLVEYAKFLLDNGITMLAVSNIEEAVALRESGIEQEILMLTPVCKEDEMTTLIENQIVLTVSSIEQIERLEKLSESKDFYAVVHIKIDTEFGRYGFLYSNKDEILKAFKMCNRVKIFGTYTHFARPLDEKFTIKQYNRFLDIINFLKALGQMPGMLHCSASTAFLKYPVMHLHGVRIGSALQGRTLVKIDGLKKIGVLKSSIQEIKTFPKGYNISYGNMYKTKHETKIAIVPVGFMDGLNMRKDRDIFSIKENIKSVGIEIKKFFKDNNIKVIINDKKYNVIGRIGMYHAIIDITDSDNISVDDEVIFDVSPMQVNSMIRREYL